MLVLLKKIIIMCWSPLISPIIDELVMCTQLAWKATRTVVWILHAFVDLCQSFWWSQVCIDWCWHLQLSTHIPEMLVDTRKINAKLVDYAFVGASFILTTAGLFNLHNAMRYCSRCGFCLFIAPHRYDIDYKFKATYLWCWHIFLI